MKLIYRYLKIKVFVILLCLLSSFTINAANNIENEELELAEEKETQDKGKTEIKTNANKKVGNKMDDDEEEEEEEDDDDSEVEEKKDINYKTFEEEDIKYRKKLWRRINLKEKANEGFYYRGYEIVKFIVEGVEKGLITPYSDYSKKEKMTIAQFNEKRLEASSAQKQEEEEDDFWGEKEVKPTKVHRKHYFFPHQISILEVEEELLFHGRRSEWSFDIKSIKLIIPKELFKTKISKELAIFDFQELMKYLDGIPEALWRSDINSSAHKKFSLAFKERLFSSTLTKVDNPADLTIRDIYGAKTDEEALIASLKEEEKLISFMDEVWVP